MLIIDAHLDLAWNALQWNRDLSASVYTLRTREQRTAGAGRALGMVAFPELRQGHVAVAFATLLARATGTPVPHVDFAAPAQAYGVAQGQLAYYRAVARLGHAQILTTRALLERHLAAWETWEAGAAGADSAGMEADMEADPGADRAPPTQGSAPPVGLVLSMEGADPILQPEDLPEWWDAGVRVIGLTHYGPGRYAGGTGTEVGLTPRGVALLDAMERLGVILDLTHCSDQAFWEALDRYHGPVLASHTNCRALVPHQRQFSDAQLRALVARGGVMGIALDAWMLQPGWISGTSSNASVGLSRVVDHIDHLCQVAGSARHAALGTDLDGGFGREQAPCDLDTIADLPRLGELLAGRGYSAADVATILHGNWVRLLRGAWASEDEDGG